jgi:hypothetical protein
MAVAGNVRVLGANNGDANAPTKTLDTAITQADVEQLRRHIAADTEGLDAPNSYGLTPLVRLIQRDHPEAAVVVIESGKIDVNRKDGRGSTPLMLAVNMKGGKAVVEALLAKGADVKGKDGMDMTALHNAVRSGDKDIVEMLVKKGADVNAVSRDGQTPYTIALGPAGQPAIAEFLKQNGGKAAAQATGASAYGNYAYPGGQGGPGGAPKRPAIQIDPNEILKKMKEFQGLAEALKPIEEKSQAEQHAWIQRKADNRTALLSEEEQQFADEMAFVKPIATEEKAANTSKAIDDLLAKRKKRTDQISEQLREQRRATLAQQRQTMASARGARGGRGQMAANNQAATPGGGAAPYANTTTKAPTNQPGADPNTQAEIQAWLNAKPEDKRALLQAVNDQNLSELQSLDAVALKEQAKKTSAAIESLMMFREQRVEKITQAWADEDAKLQKQGRGAPGTQQQMQQGTRGGRRGR